MTPSPEAVSAPNHQPVLETRDLTVSYGGLHAVDHVSIAVRRGELIGLIGPNGAGKTTTIDAICGFAASSGSIGFEGVEMSGAPAHARARAGMARTFQSVELFDDLTVRQNLLVAAQSRGGSSVLADLVRPVRRTKAHAVVEEALALMGLEDVADALPTSLPLGNQKLAGVARALASQPRLLLLDEPAAGLDSEESLVLGRRLRELIDVDGPAGLLIDHDTRLVFDVCDRVYVIDFGQIIASGTPDEVRSDHRVISAYLGSATDEGSS